MAVVIWDAFLNFHCLFACKASQEIDQWARVVVRMTFWTHALPNPVCTNGGERKTSEQPRPHCQKISCGTPVKNRQSGIPFRSYPPAFGGLLSSREPMDGDSVHLSHFCRFGWHEKTTRNRHYSQGVRTVGAVWEARGTGSGVLPAGLTRASGPAK